MHVHKFRLLRLAGMLLCLGLDVLALPLAAQVPVDPANTTSGDINHDGVFDQIDLIQLERAVTLKLSLPAAETATCDVDGNGRLTGFDLLVMTQALKRAQSTGVSMFDAIKSTIEVDLAKEGDNVQTYLDLARFMAKEGRLDRSRQVLESIMEALDTRHPLYEAINATLHDIEDKEAAKRLLEEGADKEAIYDASEDPSGKISLRRKVIEMKNKLTDLMKDQSFAASYDSKRTQGKLDAVMDNMLRKIGKDQDVDPGDITKFNGDVRSVLEDPDNIVGSLSVDQRNQIVKIVDQSTGDMRDTAMDLRQRISAAKSQSEPESQGGGLIRQEILDRRKWNTDGAADNLRVDKLIVANSPKISPDTISIVSPLYNLNWDVSNVLGARDAAVEISKVDKKFANPRGAQVDKDNTLYYNPSMGGVSGQRRGSALELEGEGTYQYRVAALDNRGEMISRFSDAAELIVVANNVNILANQPNVSPDTIYPGNPTYTFKWDIGNIEGAKDVAVEISNPNTPFSNPGGRERDRVNTFFFNPSLGRLSGSFGSNIDGLSGPGLYLFRVIGVSPVGDFVGQWSPPDTLIVTTDEVAAVARENPPEVLLPPKVAFQDTALVVSWDVSAVKAARSISLEVALSDTGGSASEKAVLNRKLPGASGSTVLKLNELEGRGRYVFRVAAADSSGTLVTMWSRPETWRYRGQSSAADTLEKNAKSQAAQEPDTPGLGAPEGKELRVATDKSPLYADKSLSSTELASLNKGDSLILVSSDGMWNRVYYAPKRTYGWVLNINIEER
ncbi:dockerin type I domain-containing protein [bacterium]|nr:dockerin type I domain-containing protein [bacterium]